MKHPVVDPARNRYPYCVVWSPLPPITWFLPFIGHTGICDSEGVIWDFAGPYTIGTDDMAFGAPTRYLQLDPDQCKLIDWDKGVAEGNGVYRHRMHNICFDNCHSHVAKCLNAMGYGNIRDRNMFSIGIRMFFFSKFVGMKEFIKTFLPFSIIIIVILVFTLQ